MKVLGITGGVGSGKSEVLNYLREAYGAVVCQMDETAKRLQEKGTGCFRKIAEAFGPEIIGADGELDRKKLGARVFSDSEQLRLLNSIVHPEVLRSVSADIRKHTEEGTPLYVVEAALLPDVGGELCDEIWYIYVSEEVRRERLKASRHYSDEKITDMIASQPSEETFRRACTAVIDNSGTFENTERQIGERLRL
ncbi:MAG: dephospho-CoA kinase [Mediterraneibacter sp.]